MFLRCNLGEKEAHFRAHARVSSDTNTEVAGMGGKKSHALLPPGDQLYQRGCREYSELSVCL